MEKKIVIIKTFPKRYLLVALIFIRLNDSLNAQSPLPWLKTSGNKILTECGQEVLLLGANILRSEWDLEMSFERLAIPHLATDWKANVILRGFASDPVNSTSFSWTSSWGKVVTHNEYMSWLDEHVSLAEKNNMYVIFAWRSYGINANQPEKPDNAAKQALVNLAKRYKGKSNVIYALQVEPHNVTWSVLQPICADMVNAIRLESAPYKPLIMIPGTDWGRDVSGAISNPVPGENLVYKSHPYNWSQDFQKYFGSVYDKGLPIFIAEFGNQGSSSSSTMGMTDVNSLLSYTKTKKIGWTAWAFDSGGNPSLIDNNTTFNPTNPYGVAIRNEIRATAPVVPGCSTSTDKAYEIKEIDQIKIYPVPVTDQLNLLINSTGKKKITISIMDLLSRIKQSENTEINSGENNFLMDVSDLENGIYFISITDGINTSIEKIIVQK